MSLVFGGTTVNNVIFNGTTIDRIIFNGVEVYTSVIPDGYLYLNGRARQGWNAWVYDNLGGLTVEDSTGNGLLIHYITVNGYVYNYQHRKYNYEPTPKADTRAFSTDGREASIGISINNDSGILYNNNNNIRYNYYNWKRFELRPFNFYDGEYLIITDITYILH